MAQYCRTCSLAVTGGSLLRVVPTEESERRGEQQPTAAFALAPLGSDSSSASHGSTPNICSSDVKLSYSSVHLPPTAAMASTLRTSRMGDKILSIGPAGVVLLQPPSAEKLASSLSASSTKALIVGEALPAYRVHTPVDACWHPLSDLHFVVLSHDGIRIFDSSTDCSVPSDEWLFKAGTLHSAPAACAFGAARGWEVFTIYIVLENGCVYYLTPVLPFGCLFPAADWRQLRTQCATVLDIPAADAVCGVHEGSTITLSWLDECFVEVGGDASWKRFLPSEASVRFARSLTHDLSTTRFRSELLLPALQGPISVLPDLVAPAPGLGLPPVPAVELAVLPSAASEFAILCVLYSDGRLVSVGCVDPILPSWCRAGRSYAGLHIDLLSPGVPVSADIAATLAGRSTSSTTSFSGGGGDEGLSSVADAAAAPWVVLDALHLQLEHPLEAARKALDEDGAAFPGGAPGAGCDETTPLLSSASGLGSHSGGGGATSVASSGDAWYPPPPPPPAAVGTRGGAGDYVFVPWLLSDANHPNILYVITRHSVFVVKHAWLPLARHLLSGDWSEASEELRRSRRGSLVYRPFHSHSHDICGAVIVGMRATPGGDPVVDPLGVPDTMLLWTVEANTPVTLSNPPSGRVGAPAFRHRQHISGTLRTVSLPSALITSELANRDLPRDPTDGGDLLHAYNRLPPFEEVVASYAGVIANARSGAIFTSPDNPESIEYLTGAAGGVITIASELKQLQTYTNSRARSILTVSKELAGKAAASQATLSDLHAQATSAHSKLTKLALISDNLRARAEAVTFGLSLLSNILSKEEVAYKAEMSEYREELAAAMKPKLEGLKEQLARIVPLAEGRGSTPSQQQQPQQPRAVVELRDVGDVLSRAMHTASPPPSTSASTIASAKLLELKAAEAVVSEAVARRQLELSETKAQLDELQRYAESVPARPFAEPSQYGSPQRRRY